ILVGHPGDEYICTHDRNGGDECLSFELAPPLVETLGGHTGVLGTGCVPPLPQLMVLGELAQAAPAGCCNFGLAEIGLLLSTRFIEIVSGRTENPPKAGTRDRLRAVETALWIDANAHEPIDLDSAAHEAGLSSFHFLRIFMNVLGVTPHQYLVRCRL